jgi:hypothetical protein
LNGFREKHLPADSELSYSTGSSVVFLQQKAHFAPVGALWSIRLPAIDPARSDCNAKEGKDKRRSFDFLRFAPVAQDDRYLVMQSFCAGSTRKSEQV